MRQRLARLATAAVVTIAVIGLTATRRGAGQSASGSDDTIEVKNCVVEFHRRAELATDRPGIIAEMPFDEGDALGEGELVVRLRDEVAEANLALAKERALSQTAIEMAQYEADAADVELRSAEKANQNQTLVPLSTVERLRLIKLAREKAVLRATEEVSLNERAEEQAQAELDSYRIHSKQSGIVTRVLKREGEAVQQGEAILEVVDASVARVEGKLHVSQARKLRIGMPVEVRLDFRDDHGELPIEFSESRDALEALTKLEDEVFTGTIGFIDVAVTDAYHEVRVWAQVDNRDGILLENLPARMTIDVGE